MKRVAGSKFLFKLEDADRVAVSATTGTIYVLNPDYPLRVWDAALGELIEVNLEDVKEFILGRARNEE